MCYQTLGGTIRRRDAIREGALRSGRQPVSATSSVSERGAPVRRVVYQQLGGSGVRWTHLLQVSGKISMARHANTASGADSSDNWKAAVRHGWRAQFTPARSATVAAMLLGTFAAVAGGLFCGSRGLFDPSEGRYCEVAREMVERNNWLLPTLDYRPHWTKPPLAYWTVAVGLGLWGVSPFGARVPYAIALGLTCAAVVWAVHRQVGPASALRSGFVFASLPFVHVGYSVITTDALVCLSQALMLAGYVTYRTVRSERAARAAGLVFWSFAGIGLLAKGPVALFVLIPISWWHRRHRPRHGVPLVSAAGICLAALLGLWWYAWAVISYRGLLQYWLAEELLARALTNRFYRNGEWYGPLVAYGPPLLLGFLPWAAGWLLRRRSRWESGPLAAAFRGALWFWIVAAVVAFSLSRSRLPLYVLPLSVPVACLIGISLARRRRPLRYVAGLSCALVSVAVAVKLLLPFVPAKRDMTRLHRRLLQEIGGLGTACGSVIAYRQTDMYGLQFHLHGRLVRIPPTEDDRDVDWLKRYLVAARRRGEHPVIVASSSSRVRLQRALRETGSRATMSAGRWWLLAHVRAERPTSRIEHVARPAVGLDGRLQ